MTTQKIERIEDIRAGDKVTLTNTNGETLIGAVRTDNVSGLYVPIFGARVYLRVLEGDDILHWSAEREVPDLPTEPGFYLDSTGDCWELQSDGQWFPFGGYGSVPQLAIVETYAPFTRMVPEGSEAKRIAEWLRNVAIDDLPGDPGSPGAAVDAIVYAIEDGSWKGDV